MADYQFLFGDEYLDKPRAAQNWIIKPLIPVGGYVNLYAKPKVGKSQLALGICHAIATGAPLWLDFPVLMHGPVLYLQADTPEGIWAEGLQKMRKVGFDFDLVGFADQTMIPYPFNALGGDCDTLAAMIDETGVDPVLIVIDVAREIHQDDENQSHVMAGVIQNLRKAVGFHRAILINSHSRKGGGEFEAHDRADESSDGLMDENRGSGYVSGKMDTIMKLTKHYLHVEGRRTGGYFKRKIRWNPKLRERGAYVWELDDDPVVEAARQAMLEEGSDRGKARTLARQLQEDEEKVRSVMRRLKRAQAQR